MIYKNKLIFNTIKTLRMLLNVLGVLKVHIKDVSNSLLEYNFKYMLKKKVKRLV